jgi:hypothetical protein
MGQELLGSASDFSYALRTNEVVLPLQTSLPDFFVPACRQLSITSTIPVLNPINGNDHRYALLVSYVRRSVPGDVLSRP